MIAHIDVDYFFAQVEELDNPKLKNIPFAVGSKSSRSVLSTCNYLARSYGVRSGMPNFKAIEKCPDLTFVELNKDKYLAKSKQIFSALRLCFSNIEIVSIDEAFIDLTSELFINNSPIDIAEKIKNLVFCATNLTVSVGISCNKLMAKIATSVNKPNGYFFIAPDNISNFISSVPVSKLPGVGPVNYSKLTKMNIFTCQDLQEIKKNELIFIFGKYGNTLYDFCRGMDKRPFNKCIFDKSISVERTSEVDLLCSGDCIKFLNKIYQDFLERVDLESKTRVSGIFIKLTDKYFKRFSASAKSNSFELDLYLRLFYKLYTSKNYPPIRLLGLGVQLQKNKNLQLSLW